MTRIRNSGCTLFVALAFSALAASAQSTPANAPAPKNAPAKAAPAAAQKAASAKGAPAATQTKANTAPDPGERAFQANCTRCHYAPEQLNPRISGTILMHMRVRASLSAQDERDIMHFLVP